MKKYLALAIACLSAFSLFIYLYYHAQSKFLENHFEVNDILSDARQNETSLDRDTLKIESMLLDNYDSLVLQLQYLNDFCAVNVTRPDLFEFLDAEVKEHYHSYCRQLHEKESLVEHFKSLNSIYRNSSLFIHKILTEKLTRHKGLPSPKEWEERKVVVASLNFSNAPNEASKERLIEILSYAKSVKQNPELAYVIKHAEILLKAKSELLDIGQELLASQTIQSFDNLKGAYYLQYLKEQRKSLFFQNLIFALGILLIAIVTYSVLKVWKGAQALKNSNATLEDRVRERTQLLLESQRTIVEQQQTVMIASKMSALGEMAGGLAHEINTPLAVIQMRTDQLIECLRESPMDIEAMNTALEAIDHVIRRISKIVNGLRSFARDGRKDPIEPCRLSAIIEDTFSLCREKFNNHGVSLTYKGADEIILNCRPGEISQVLLNFLNNAYDAIQNINDKWVRIIAVDNGKNVVISIIDCGRGIPPDVQEKMMQPFFTTKETGKGTGLGLSISKGIIESHGGKIVINNEAPHTQFDIILPSVAQLKSTAS